MIDILILGLLLVLYAELNPRFKKTASAALRKGKAFVEAFFK